MNNNNRLTSLDVFRGQTIAAMLLVNFPGSWGAIYGPLEHAQWVGTTPTDFIFPFFIFIVGISVALAFTKQLEAGKTKSELLTKSFWRFVKIFAIGMFLKILPTFDFSRIELPGVLQRIALVFIACAILFLYTGWKSQLYIALGIQAAYVLALKFIPVSNIGAGILEPGKNLTNWMDGVVIPHFLLNKKGYDSEGFLSTFPAITSGITGLMAGRLLIISRDKQKTVQTFLLTGFVLTIAGYGLSLYLPIIKRIWTSSYVLVTSGWAFMVFALIYWLVEIKELKTGLKPWIIFGSNAIAMYVLADVFETLYYITGLHDFAMTTMVNSGIYIYTASLLWAIFSVLTCFVPAYILYRKKIFIKL